MGPNHAWEEIMQEYQLWIDGHWQASDGGGQITIVNPATEQPIANVIDGSRARCRSCGASGLARAL